MRNPFYARTILIRQALQPRLVTLIKFSDNIGDKSDAGIPSWRKYEKIFLMLYPEKTILNMMESALAETMVIIIIKLIKLIINDLISL